VSLPYVYTPRPGEWLRVSRDEEGRCMVGVAAEESGYAHSARFRPDDVPAAAAGIATAMHEAAGLPAPVILERPGATIADGVNRAGSIEVGRLRDRVTVGLYGIQPEEIEPAVARRLAALIAIRAGEVRDGKPDPAEVEELTGKISDALRSPVIDSSLDLNTSRVAARAALRWFRDKQQRGETS
jgi:hypothetical protein